MKNILKLFLLTLTILTAHSVSISQGSSSIFMQEAMADEITEVKTFQLFKPKKIPSPVFDTQQPDTKHIQKTILDKFIPKFSIRLLVFVAIGSLLGLLYGGFLYIFDLGEDQNMEQAKKVITYSLVGLIVAFMSFAIVQIINVLPLNF